MSRQALLIALTLTSLLLLIPTTTACKDLIAIESATKGDYNLLLKVRDPSRPGPQVLVKIPQGYQYTYHTPWIGRPLLFTVHHAFIGVASANDTPPNIIKAGMALTDAGIAFGDADTGSSWRNPSPYAWDDFDCLRYAYQTANTTQDAVTLLTQTTTNLHATSVSENLFVIGPTDATLIETDAVHTHTTPITNLSAMTNAPNALWHTQRLKTRALATAFNDTLETWAHRGSILHLGSWCGIQITHIGTDNIRIRPIPAPYFLLSSNIRTATTITLHASAVIGGYHVTLQDLNATHAKIRLSIAYADWTTEVISKMQECYGAITTEDFMNWSRLHTEDLGGLRPLCEDAVTYEAAMIFQIPTTNASTLASAWFSPNHACASIYVPVHVSDTRIDDFYTTPEAADLSRYLLTYYGHGTLSTVFHRTERIFLHENARLETLATHLPATNATLLLTAQDTGAQHQAFQTEYLWNILNDYSHDSHYPLLRTELENLWNATYNQTIQNMNATVNLIQDYRPLTQQIAFLAATIVNTTLHTITYQGINIPQPMYDLYYQGLDDITHGQITTGVAILLQVYEIIQDLQ
jgi:hypothetical protein